MGKNPLWPYETYTPLLVAVGAPAFFFCGSVRRRVESALINSSPFSAFVAERVFHSTRVIATRCRRLYKLSLSS